jgi:hypothetical protein
VFGKGIGVVTFSDPREFFRDIRSRLGAETGPE